MAQTTVFNRIPQVLIADDYPAILKTVNTILTPHFDVVAAVSDGKAAVHAATWKNPDLVVLDITMPELNGFETARELRQKQSRAKVVFLTAQEDDDCVSEALVVGAKGYVVKRRLQSDLLPALRVAHAGHVFISPHAFVGHTDEDIIKPNGTTASPVTLGQKNGNNEHVMEFYSEDSHFISRMSEVAYTSLKAGKSIIVLFKRSHLESVSKQLASSDIDLAGAIRWGDYRALSVEGVAPILMPDGQMDATRFFTFFNALFEHMALNSQKKCSEVVVLGNLASALLDSGYEHQTAAQAEQLWNDLSRRHGCVVHCGYSVTHLASAGNRQAFSQICCEHSRVIPIDQAPAGSQNLEHNVLKLHKSDRQSGSSW